MSGRKERKKDAKKDARKNVFQITKKVQKSKDIDTIASELEEEPETIKPLYDVVVAAAPDYDIDKIMTKISNKEK